MYALNSCHRTFKSIPLSRCFFALKQPTPINFSKFLTYSIKVGLSPIQNFNNVCWSQKVYSQTLQSLALPNFQRADQALPSPLLGPPHIIWGNLPEHIWQISPCLRPWHYNSQYWGKIKTSAMTIVLVLHCLQFPDILALIKYSPNKVHHSLFISHLHSYSLTGWTISNVILTTAMTFSLLNKATPGLLLLPPLSPAGPGPRMLNCF